MKPHGAHGRQRLEISWAAAASLCLVGLIGLARVAHTCKRVNFGRDFNGDQKIACRCDETYCDTKLEFEWPRDGETLFRLTSSLAGARFEPSTLRLGELLPSQGESKARPANFTVRVDINKRFQQVVGYGGAFTDSASMLISDKVGPQAHRDLMSSYFSPTGLDYNLARVPIGGTDMSWRPYSYNDMPAGQEDFELAGFKLAPEDFDYKLPVIREANLLRGEPLKLLASSWSAPNWMKSNHSLVQGRLKDDDDSFDNSDDDLYSPSLQSQRDVDASKKTGTTTTSNIKGKYYDAYARYICKFMDVYEHELSAGAPLPAPAASAGAGAGAGGPFKMWALTPQNEPCTPGRLGYSVVNYNSVNFDPDQMSQFIRVHLIPNLLRNNRTARELALFIWDDTLLGFDRYKNRLFDSTSGASSRYFRSPKSPKSALKILRDDLSSEFSPMEIENYIRGMALHWYSQGLDKLPYKVLYDLRRWLPPRFSMISTEASFIGRPIVGDWSRGEKYARDIIENFRSGSIGWIDWNLALNLEGGPTWSRNFLDAPILVDEHSRSFLKNPMFYAIGHLSRFIKPRSYIVESQVRVPMPSSADENSKSGPPVWRLVDEDAEQTSELLVVASELYFDGAENSTRPAGFARKIALVLLNRGTQSARLELELANCQSKLGQAGPLELELEPKSFTSLAFNC